MRDESAIIVGDRVKLRWQSGETGTIIEIIEREYLPNLFKIRWDDPDKGEGVLRFSEFELTKRAI